MTVGLFANFILLSGITNKPSSSNTTLHFFQSAKILESKPLTAVPLTDIVHSDVLSSYFLKVLTFGPSFSSYTHLYSSLVSNKLYRNLQGSISRYTHLIYTNYFHRVELMVFDDLKLVVYVESLIEAKNPSESNNQKWV